MTYAWSGFRIACLGEKSPAQSVEQPDSHNAAVLYNDTEIFPRFVMPLGRNAISKGRNVDRVRCFHLGKMSSSQHVYEIRPRKDRRGLDLISERLPLGVLWFEGADANEDAVNYARAFSYPHPAIIRVLNESRTFAVTLESVDDFSRPVDISARPLRHCLMSSSQ